MILSRFAASLVMALAFVGILSESDETYRSTTVVVKDYKQIAQEYTKGWENIKLTAYKDNTRYSIGYGTISYKGEVITEKEAERRFNEYWEQNIPDVRQYVSSKGQYMALTDTLYNKGGSVKRFVTNGKIDCYKIAAMENINQKYYNGVKNRRTINYKLCTGEIEWNDVK